MGAGMRMDASRASLRADDMRLTEERIRLLVDHYLDRLPRAHPLYSECYKQAEEDTASALNELLEARTKMSLLKGVLDNMAHDFGVINDYPHWARKILEETR
jgi:hypothetical protein